MSSIDRQTAIETVSNLASSMSVCLNIDESHGMKRMQEMAVIVLSRLPSAEPERKKGEWIKEDSIYETVTCSVCHGVRRDNRINHINFCNCCGADMRGEQNG